MPSLSFQKWEAQGRQNFSPLKDPGSDLSETEGQESRSETEVLRMQENTETTRDRHEADVTRIAEKIQHLTPEQAMLLENVVDTFLLAIAQAAQASNKI